MIITTKEGYNKHQGTDLPMFSRSGKSTVNQYLAFQSKAKHNNDDDKSSKKDDSDVDDDIGLLMGEKPRDIAQEM